MAVEWPAGGAHRRAGRREQGREEGRASPKVKVREESPTAPAPGAGSGRRNRTERGRPARGRALGWRGGRFGARGPTRAGSSALRGISRPGHRHVLTFGGPWGARGGCGRAAGRSSASTHSASRAEGGLGVGALTSSSLRDPRGPTHGHGATSAPTPTSRPRSGSRSETPRGARPGGPEPAGVLGPDTASRRAPRRCRPVTKGKYGGRVRRPCVSPGPAA